MAPMTRSAFKRKREIDGRFDNFRELPTCFLKPTIHENTNNKSKISKKYKTEFGVRGLINLGASCYINSVMQAFIHTSPLRDYFLTESHKCSEEHASACQMCALSKIFKEYYTGNVLPPMSLHRLLYLVWLEAPGLAGIEQQDAHEFYMIYIQLLHNSCLRSTGKRLYTLKGLVNPNPCCCIVDQLYAGIIESSLTCSKCKTASLKREIFYDISLQLDSNEMEDLCNCLGNYTKSENLGDSSEIYCPNCASKQEFIKRLSLVTLPNILNINFKRFTQNGTQQKKLSKHVIFPFELDMKPFISEFTAATNDELYALIAVISHSGSMNSGHYTVYIKQTSDIWLLCNDHKIKPVTPETVLATEAYMLVFERK